MLAAHENPLYRSAPDSVSPRSGIAWLERLATGDPGDLETLPQRALQAACNDVRAVAGRFWAGSADTEARLAAVAGTPLPWQTCLRNTAGSGVQRPDRSDIQIISLEQFDDPVARSWGRQAGLTCAVVQPLSSGGRRYGQVELFLTSVPSTVGLDALRRAASWLALAAALAESRARRTAAQDLAKLLLKASPAAIISYDENRHVRTWNPAAERLFGWSAADAIGQPLRIVPAERQNEFEQLHDYVRTGKPAAPINTIRQRNDGLVIPVQSVALPLFDENRNVIGVIETLSDQTPQRRLLRHSQVERRLQEIMSLADSVAQAGEPLLQTLCEALGWETGELWLHDAERDVLALEASWTRPRAGTAASKPPHCEVGRGEGLAGASWEAGRAVFVPELHDDAANARTKSAVRRSQAGYSIPIRVGQRFLGVLGFRDPLLEEPADELRHALEVVAAAVGQFLQLKLTEEELRAEQARLRQSQKVDAVGMLAGGIAHDFNNVLTVILSYSELASEEIDADHPAREMLHEIHNAGRRAASMTRRLLTFTRQHKEDLQVLNLNDAVSDMERMLRRLIGQGINLETCLDPELGSIRGDPSQIDQMLVNFVVNARDATPAGGRVTIATRNVSLSAAEAHLRPGARAGDFVVLSVKDTGCGMDDATKARIFEPFFTTKGVGRGTGMGLATVAGIVSQAGGFIDVVTAPGQGTEMIVHLPRVQEKLATLEVDRRLEPTPGGSETVIVIEDDETLRTLLRRVLQVRGYHVLESPDPATALRSARTAAPPVSLVLANIHLSSERREQLAADLRKISRRIRLLVLADAGEHGEPQQTDPTDPGVCFLHKPFNSQELARRIRSALDSHP